MPEAGGLSKSIEYEPTRGGKRFLKKIGRAVEFRGCQTTKGAGQIKPKKKTMQFMMLMIPAVYQGGKKVAPGFVHDAKKMEEMTKFNEELGKAVKIISLNGLHPLATGARVAFGKGKP